jgi:hypothetical protein
VEGDDWKNVWMTIFGCRKVVDTKPIICDDVIDCGGDWGDVSTDNAHAFWQFFMGQLHGE